MEGSALSGGGEVPSARKWHLNRDLHEGGTAWGRCEGLSGLFRHEPCFLLQLSTSSTAGFLSV